MKKLGFGLMRLPVRSENPTDIDQETFNRMVDRFLEQGFTYFDTSYVYHNGASETAIREALVKRHERGSFVLASKFPTFMMPDEAQAEGIFHEQLEKRTPSRTCKPIISTITCCTTSTAISTPRKSRMRACLST